MPNENDEPDVLDLIKEVEKTEDIKIKVYWNRKDWVKVGGNIVTPDNGIQTIFFATDLPKFQKAKELIDKIYDVIDILRNIVSLLIKTGSS